MNDTKSESSRTPASRTRPGVAVAFAGIMLMALLGAVTPTAALITGNPCKDPSVQVQFAQSCGDGVETHDRGDCDEFGYWWKNRGTCSEEEDQSRLEEFLEDPAGSVKTNADEWAVSIVPYAIDALQNPLTPPSLVNVKQAWADVVTYGEAFTIGWLLEHGGGPLPVDVSLSAIATATQDVTGDNVTSCAVNRARVVGNGTDPLSGTDPAGSTDRKNIRLYPDVWVDTVAGNFSLQNHVLVMVSGYAGTATGTDGWKQLECAISVPFVATNVVETEVDRVLEGIVMALPPANVLIPLGSIAIDEVTDPDTYVATPSAPAAIPLTGLTDNVTVKAQAVITWKQGDDDWNNGDYVTYQFSGDGDRVVERWNGGRTEPVAHEYTIADDGTTSVCVSATLMDEDINKDDVYMTAGPICTSIGYQKVSPGAVEDLPVPCQAAVNEFLAGRVASPQDFLECAGLATMAGGPPGLAGAKDYVAFPILVDGNLKEVFIIPRTPEP